MSNYIEYKDGLAFHPGYYIKETIEESGITQEDFAKRLGTTPKNLSLLVRGEQNLSFDIALKLSKMLGTSVEYWMNLQSVYDTALSELSSVSEMQAEIEVVKNLGYAYFRDHFDLPDLPRQLEEQVKALRLFLSVSDLCYLKDRNLAVSFRGVREGLTESNIEKANAMVQIAVNHASTVEAPPYNKQQFEIAVKEALALTSEHASFLESVYESFMQAGVILEVLPNLKGSKINGATKRLATNVLLMVNDRGQYADTFWFTLFHEIGHIMNGDFGASFPDDKGEKEDAADKYAKDTLIDPVAYAEFCMSACGDYTIQSVMDFAKRIGRDPGIVVGRLQNDGRVERTDRSLASLRSKYRIKACC